MNVFLSVGRTSTSQQEEFVRAIEAHLRANGLEPKTVGRTSFSSNQPLRHVQALMEECAGTVIIAFERTHFEKGIEYRGGSKEETLTDIRLPTVWNQIEASMAYAHGHPLLVIMQHGLKSEGLLEKGYDWYVQWVELDSSTLGGAEFQGVFADWKRRLTEGSGRAKARGAAELASVDVEKLSLGRILSSLTVPQLWGMAAAIITFLVAVATVAFKLGGGR